MANSVAIPQDIIDNIIEAVGDDRRLLKNCALVSSSFLSPSRKPLFSNIYLGNDQACQRLLQILVENPVIQPFVRHIDIDSYKTFKSHSLIAILRLPFCCLESFSLDGFNTWRSLHWNDFSSELKDVLLTIIHSPTLKTLCLQNVSVPIMLFHGIHLTKLEFGSFLINDFAGEQSRLLTSAASEEVATTASQTMIDQCVWSFRTAMYGTSAYYSRSLVWDMEGPTKPIFLPFMCRLRVFEIDISSSTTILSDFDILSFLICSLPVSLTSPATLEHLKIAIVFEGDDYLSDCLCLLDGLRDADVWSHLDSIITHPTGSRLQRVDINIVHAPFDDYYAGESDGIHLMGPVLDALPLLRKKGILFVEAKVMGRE